MKTQCSVARLQSALVGNLPADDEAALQQHLEECDECGAALEQMAGGAAWCQQAAALLSEDDLDAVAATCDQWSAVDFTVEHLEPADEPNLLGRLGGYDILEIIGHGGMGVVLKAFDRELKRCVAIKVLAPHLAQSSLAKKRFAREAQAAAAVVHPNVLAIHHVQPSGRLPFLVMPLVAGESLAERLAVRGTLDLKETLRVGMQAAAGLAAAHEQGLVHRDVKPANILLEKGVERVLTDFGLARAADDVALTRWGVIAGTPQYMSPEQARGEPLDGRSDLFSLGSVLYEMASGVSPFRTDSTIATMRRLLDDSPQALSSHNPELPPWFIAIVDRLLQKDPARRFGSAQEVSELLEGCLAHLQQPASVPLPAAVRTSMLRRPAWRSIFRNQRNTGVVAMITAFVLALFGGFYLSAEPPDIAGEWSGEEWGRVVLKKTSDTEYTGTYTDTFGNQPGDLQLKWSRIEHQFTGAWREGEDRFGEISLRLTDKGILGAHTTDAKSKINPGTPRLAGLAWTRANKADATTEITVRGGVKVDAAGSRLTANSIDITLPYQVRDVTAKLRMMFRHDTKNRVAALAYSSDGKMLAIGGELATVNILDTETGKSIAKLNLFSKEDEAILVATDHALANVEVRALAFSPDSSTLAVGTDLGQVKVFDVRNGTLLLALDDVARTTEAGKMLPKFLELPLAQGNVWAVAFSPDGTLLATCGDAIDYNQDHISRLGLGPTEGLLKLWDAKTGKLKQHLDGQHSGQVLDVAFSPDGKFLASAGHWGVGSGVNLWDPQTGKVTKVLEVARGNLGGGSPLCLGFSPDGKRLAMGLMQYDKASDITSGSIHVVYPASGILDLSWKVPHLFRPVAFSHDGKTIAAISDKTVLSLWDSATGKLVQEFKLTDRPQGQRLEWFAFSPTANVLAAGGMDVEHGGFVAAWSLDGVAGDREKLDPGQRR